MPRPLRKPLFRRIGRLNVCVDGEGLLISGFRKKRRHRVTWSEIAFLAATKDEGGVLFSDLEGNEFLERIGGQTAAQRAAQLS